MLRAIAIAVVGFLALMTLLVFIGIAAFKVAVAPLFALSAVFVLLSVAFWVWMLIDIAVNEPDHGSTKIAWLLVVLFGQLLGALIYFIVRRPQRLTAH